MISSWRHFGSLLFLNATFLTCISLLIFTTAATHLTNETDRLALLAIKDQISVEYPNQILSSWNDSLHFCMWGGVTCSRRHPQRVTALNLTRLNLAGYLSPHIGNLSFLSVISLRNNSFQGQIPQEIGHLCRLRFVDLSFNSFTGEIPRNLTQCTKLRVFGLHNNNLVGKIPPEFGSMSELVLLALNQNSLIGHIPPALGNLSSLTYLYLASNGLDGNIPHDLGRLSKLQLLQLTLNQLSGFIPSSLYNVSSLHEFDVGFNHLSGTVPPDLAVSLPNLRWFSFSDNLLSGPLPISLSNASGIEDLDFSANGFSGSVPMNLDRLQGLVWFNLEANQLGGEKEDELGFITSLTNCSNLKLLAVAYNRLSGALPSSIANLSSQLTQLLLHYNQIFGTIPSGIVNLASLNLLAFQNNLLTGSIPFDIGKLQTLEVINLQNNSLSGQIPESLGNLTRLFQLYLHRNELQGSIPWILGNCHRLEELFLYRNNFNGTIPKEVLHIPPLRVLQVHMNSLSGSLPPDMDGLKNLEVLSVSNNKFSGEIPNSLGSCVRLEGIYMEGNFFLGSIPSLSTLKGLQELDLSRNNLSGQIPKYLEEFQFLQYLNLSFNDLNGEVPEHGVFKNASAFSVQGNGKLCGGVTKLKLPPCSKQAPKKHKKALSLTIKIIPGVAAALFLFLLSCIFGVGYWLKNSNPPRLISLMGERFLEVTYAELLKATDGFSSANLIGGGSFGFVYKGFLDQIGLTVAVKVLKLQQQRASKSFIAECKALKSIQHRNIVKILTVCSSIDFSGNDFKALVFEYMPNGSLDTWLHPNENEQPSKHLSFIQRLNAAIDVASALDYLHHHCEAPVVHCDLKPSNVLLDEDMVAHVGDFGLARVFSKDVSNCTQDQSSSVGIKGSIGYLAPEYGMGIEVSTYGDVYSFGILLLEMFTGKRPTDQMFKDNLNIHQLAEMVFPERVIEIIDHLLILEDTETITHNENHNEMKGRMHECLLSLVRIGISCSSEAPKERMEIKDVVIEMHKVRDFYLGANKYRTIQTMCPLSLEGPSYISNY